MKLVKPIIIVGAPRSGTTFLKELLTFHADLWHLPQESHHILEGPLHPKNFHSFSNRPDENFRLSEDKIKKMRADFWKQAINISIVPGGLILLNRFRENRYIRKGLINVIGQLSRYYKFEKKGIRFIEKTPKNTVRIPWIKEVFPDAKFIYIKRKPIGNINSILRGWYTDTGLLYKLIKGKPRFASAGYEIDSLEKFHLKTDLKDNYWRFVLPPGWENQEFRDLMDIAIYQYQKSNELAEGDLMKTVEPKNIFRLKYEDLTDDRENIVDQLLSFTDLSKNGFDYRSLYKMSKINQTGNKIFLDIDNKEIDRRLSKTTPDS